MALHLLMPCNRRDLDCQIPLFLPLITTFMLHGLRHQEYSFVLLLGHGQGNYYYGADMRVRSAVIFCSRPGSALTEIRQNGPNIRAGFAEDSTKLKHGNC